MAYLQSHRRDNSSSALSFTSSTAGSATGASFSSIDDPSGKHSSMLLSLKSIFESVYRCDSAAVVDKASSCGSVANQALYQGVEVILKTATCSNDYGTKNLTDSVKESVASKPFFEYQCFCDDDDFIVNNDVWRCKTITSTTDQNDSSAAITSQHTRMASTGSCGSGSEESRNERSNPSIGTASLFVATENDDAMRNNEVSVECEEAVFIRKTKWQAHTSRFYSKINSPNQRMVTTLSDVTAGSISPRRRPMSVELVPSLVSKIEDDEKNNNSNIDDITAQIAPTAARWVPRNNISEIREQ